MSVATVALKHHKSYFTAKKESYLPAQGYWSMYNSFFILWNVCDILNSTTFPHLQDKRAKI